MVYSIRLKEPALAVKSPTVADDLLVLHGSNLVVVIPAKLLASRYKLHGKKGNTRESEVMAVYEHVLHKYIWVTAVVEVSANVSLRHRVHYINILVGSEVFAY